MNNEIVSDSFRLGTSQTQVLLAQDTTTDATPKVIKSIQLPADCVAIIECSLTAFRTSGSGSAGDSAYYVLRARAKFSSGVCSLVNLIKEENETLQSWDADFSSSNDGIVQLKVTGESSTNISWNATIRLELSY